MKKKTQLEHSQIANNMMYYIFKHIETPINMDELAQELGVSKFHLHRLFKKQMGSNIYESIKSIRLQKASNLLITNSSSTITEVANMCGYSSQTSFIRAFKERFAMTPKFWRKGGYKSYSNQILKSSTTASLSTADYSNLEPNIVKTKAQKAYYIRHKGYNKKIRQRWQKMMAWVYSNEIEEYEQIGIYHDNPIITPLDECFYISAIVIKEEKNLENTSLPHFEIPAGIYATFEVEGRYGDILKLIQWAYHEWLPQSGYETTTHPSYTVLHKNHFLEEDGEFRVCYYLPIRLI
jgi:AraC family transcriptional regulator